MPAVLDDVSAEILDLKKQLGATILAHYYQEGEIQALADITGDSLKLAREATHVESPVIVFCGVLFIAETAKMLNPDKTVLLPDLQAGCSLVDACPADKLAHSQDFLRANDRKFQTVCYINSSAKVKALSDWVVTSGNAVEVVRDKVPPGYEVLFVPDKHLGRYVGCRAHYTPSGSPVVVRRRGRERHGTAAERARRADPGRHPGRPAGHGSASLGG